MKVYYIITAIYLPEIKQKTAIQICFDDDNQTLSFNLSGTVATAVFRPYDGSLRYLFFSRENSPAPILNELHSILNIKIIEEEDFLNYYECDGPFDMYLEDKMNKYFSK